MFDCIETAWFIQSVFEWKESNLCFLEPFLLVFKGWALLAVCPPSLCRSEQTTTCSYRINFKGILSLVPFLPHADNHCKDLWTTTSFMSRERTYEKPIFWGGSGPYTFGSHKYPQSTHASSCFHQHQTLNHFPLARVKLEFTAQSHKTYKHC